MGLVQMLLTCPAEHVVGLPKRGWSHAAIWTQEGVKARPTPLRFTKILDPALQHVASGLASLGCFAGFSSLTGPQPRPALA